MAAPDHTNWLREHHPDDNNDQHFRRCWGHNACSSCLGQSACSWCPYSSTCVPNDCIVPPLAPAFDDMVCPYWAERWELRTHPLGCQVSTITSLTAIVAGSSTLLVAALILALVFGVQLWRRRRREGRITVPLWLHRILTVWAAAAAWVHRWRPRPIVVLVETAPTVPAQGLDEQTPLLSS